jgi:hypothetical protein
MRSKKYIPWVVSRCDDIDSLGTIIRDTYDNCVEDYEFEVGVVKSDNKLGLSSGGWEGGDKIILFDNDNYQFESVAELRRFLKKATIVANMLCEALNLNKIDL